MPGLYRKEWNSTQFYWKKAMPWGSWVFEISVKTKHCKSIESYLVRILLFPCMPMHWICQMYSCICHSRFVVWLMPSTSRRFLPAGSDTLAYRLWNLQLYVALNLPRELINTHRPYTGGPVNIRPVNCDRPSESGRLYCKAITPCAEEGQATRDYCKGMYFKTCSHTIGMHIY